MPTKIEPSDEKNPFRDIKVGHRLWICSTSEPSEFEVLLSDALRQAAPNNKSDTVFYVSAYSFYGADNHVKYLLSSLPNIELPYDAIVSFITLEKEMSFAIPNPQTSGLREADKNIQHIVVNEHKFTLQKQILLIFACNHRDFDRADRLLRGFSDLIGFISLIIGASIEGQELFGSYFCIEKKKIISGNLKVTERHPLEQVILNFKNIFESNDIDLQDDIINSAIWFAGRAFITQEAKSKPIFYYTSIEIACGRSLLNTIGKIYTGKVERAKAEECFKQIKGIRDKIVHRGIAEDIESALERLLQAIILDAIMFRIKGKCKKTALESLLMHKTTGE